MAFHETFTGAENAETLVLVHLSGLYQRLLAHDAVTFDFSVLADRIVNEPAAGQEPCGL